MQHSPLPQSGGKTQNCPSFAIHNVNFTVKEHKVNSKEVNTTMIAVVYLWVKSPLHCWKQMKTSFDVSPRVV